MSVAGAAAAAAQDAVRRAAAAGKRNAEEDNESTAKRAFGFLMMMIYWIELFARSGSRILLRNLPLRQRSNIRHIKLQDFQSAHSFYMRTRKLLLYLISTSPVVFPVR